MFLPSENHLQIARESSKYMQIDLENYARSKNILITGPRNFLIDLDWFDKLMSMEENNKLANELMDTINPLFSASKVLFGHFADHAKSINQVVKSAEKINSSFSKTLINTLQKVKDKGYKNPDIEKTLESSEKISESGLDQVSEPQDNLYKLEIIKKKKD
jgi:DNA anti-recombination protein RmuC